MKGVVEYLKTVIEFLQDVNMDRKKVSWPNWQETRAATLVVVVAVLISAVFLGLVDWSFASIVQAIMD